MTESAEPAETTWYERYQSWDEESTRQFDRARVERSPVAATARYLQAVHYGQRATNELLLQVVSSLERLESGTGDDVDAGEGRRARSRSPGRPRR